MFRTFTSALFAAVVSAAGADYSENGANWTGLCAYGREQSPIDLKDATPNSTMEVIGYNYYDFKVQSTFKNDKTNYAKTINFDVDSLRKQAELELTFADGSKSYFQPLQFHFHAPSEHAVNGKLYDLEVHFVHTTRGSHEVPVGGSAVAQDELAAAVIGIFFDVQEGGDFDNAFLDAMFIAIAGKGLSTPPKVPLRDFLSRIDMSEYWSYKGSLTTPPCTEGLKWTVIKQVQPISKAQLQKFTQYLADDASFGGGNGNNRVVQPLHDRTLYMASESGATYITASLVAAATAMVALAF